MRMKNLLLDVFRFVVVVVAPKMFLPWDPICIPNREKGFVYPKRQDKKLLIVVPEEWH
jgi:hypothetical protein